MPSGIVIKPSGNHKHFFYNGVEEVINDEYQLLEVVSGLNNEEYLIIGCLDGNKPINKFDVLTRTTFGNIYIFYILNGQYADASYKNFLTIYHTHEDIDDTEEEYSEEDEYDYNDDFLVRDD